MKKLLLFAFAIVFFVVFALVLFFEKGGEGSASYEERFWEVQSIDTMKYSRDVAREKNKDLEFDKEIDDQVQKIAKAGATHVAIGTPYDEEFIPFLARWVKAARKYKLNVWFRGNFSGWEEWFGYEPITRGEHTNLIYSFIINNQDLFEDGDIFTSCTECENGGPGDPRRNKDVAGHRGFLISEYEVSKRAFNEIGKDVQSNFFSMNGDVARLVMDRETTKALGGLVVIDHYVGSIERLVKDIQSLSESSGGKVFLGEFGAPIPDIHGKLSEDEQANWIAGALDELSKINSLLGLNYWVGKGGSTRLWNDDGEPRKAYASLQKYFLPVNITGKVVNELGSPIVNAVLTSDRTLSGSDKLGRFTIIVTDSGEEIRVTKNGYEERNLMVKKGENIVVILKKVDEGFLFRIGKNIRGLLH